MKFLKHILARDLAFLWAVLKPLGSWGVFAFAGVDAALLGMPLDPIVAGYVYSDERHFWIYVVMAAAGSAVGSIVLYCIGRAGGEVLLHRRMSKERYERIKRSFDRHEFLALMLPSMLPPPFPFKLVVLSAAAFEMNFGHFLLAIFVGRLVRFGVLAILTIRFGPQVVNFVGVLFHDYLWLVLVLLAAAGLAWYWRRRSRRAKNPAASQE